MKRRIFLVLLLSGLLLTSTAGLILAAPAAATDTDALQALAQALAEVRQATDKYHDVGVAQAAGYSAPAPFCVSSPAGGMGIHYVKSDLVDTSVDKLTPEILLYVPTATGVRLVGLEYSAIALANNPSGPPTLWFAPGPPPSGWFTTAPTVFGQTLNGPMAGHGPGEPWHYDLHVWLWEWNPAGLFAQFNRNVSCS